MEKLRILGLAFGMCAAAGCSHAPPSPAGLVDTGTVRGVYVQVAPDIFLAESLVGEAASGPRWARVELQGTHRPLNARVAAGQPVQTGDRVEVAMGDAEPRIAELLPASTRVVAVLPVQPVDSPARREFNPLSRLLAEDIAN